MTYRQRSILLLALHGLFCPIAEAAGITLIDRTVFVRSPREGVRVNARSYYTRARGLTLKSFHNHQSRSDTADVAYQRFSDDNGETWSDPLVVKTRNRVSTGTHRRYPRIGFVDVEKDILIEFWLDGILPGDDPLEGMKHWTLRYGLSRDGGRTTFHESAILHIGSEYSTLHPFPGVFIGRNSMMIGDQSCTTIRLGNGDILQPVQITPLGPNGEYYNPGGGYTYHDAAVLIGMWTDDSKLDWTISERVVADPERSTRGMLEPTIAEFSDGRILMILRGSNHRKPHLPSYRWWCVSQDAGRTWSKPQPWSYMNGTTFYSPSSCSQLLSHSTGRVFWIGNICEKNANGNLPRHPLVIGLVDPATLKLVEASLCTIDQRNAGDSEKLQISNFFAREDRTTNDIIVHCSPLNRTEAFDADGRPLRTNWTADAIVYRLKVDEE